MSGEISNMQFNVYVRNAVVNKEMSQSQNKTVGVRNRRFTLAIKIAVSEKAFDFRNDGLWSCNESQSYKDENPIL